VATGPACFTPWYVSAGAPVSTLLVQHLLEVVVALQPLGLIGAAAKVGARLASTLRENENYLAHERVEDTHRRIRRSGVVVQQHAGELIALVLLTRLEAGPLAHHRVSPVCANDEAGARGLRATICLELDRRLLAKCDIADFDAAANAANFGAG
jgi:hypothetical protein